MRWNMCLVNVASGSVVDEKRPAQVGAAATGRQVESHPCIGPLDPQRRPDDEVGSARLNDCRFHFVIEQMQPRPDGLAMGIAEVVENDPRRRGLIALLRAELLHVMNVTAMGHRQRTDYLWSLGDSNS